MAAWQLDMLPWRQAELTNPGLLPRPPRPPTPYALTPTSKCRARHVVIDTWGLYGMMRDAGMLGVLTEEGVTSLKKFRNGALPDPAEPGQFIEGPKDSQVANRWDALLADPRRQKLASPKHSFAQIVHTNGVAQACRSTRRAAADGTTGTYYRDSGITRQVQAIKTWLAQLKPQLNALSHVSSKPSSLASYRRFADTVLATYDAMWAEVSQPRWANAKFRLYCGKQRVVARFWSKAAASTFSRDWFFEYNSKGKVVCVCKRCSPHKRTQLSVANMSQLHSRHKCQVDGEQQPANKRSHDTQFGPLPREDKGAPVSADMQRAVRRRIGLFLVTQQAPFMTVDNIHLQAAFQLLGLELLKEKHYRTQLLDELYQEVKQVTMKELRELAKPSPAQPSPAQPSPAQPSPAQPSPAQPSPAQPSPAQPSPAQPSPAQPSPAQPSPAQPSPAQPSPAQPSPAQPSPAQPSPACCACAQEGFVIVSDGWKNKFAGRGSPLINFLVLKPDGGMLFLRVVDVSGKRKDALAIMELHMEILHDLRKDLDMDSVMCVGFIMDNTSANLSAMRMLQRAMPTIVIFGCTVHAMNLLCKDLSKPTKLEALQQEAEEEGVANQPKAAPATPVNDLSVAEVLEAVQILSLVVSDCEAIRSELKAVQGNERHARSVRPNNPTRFAGLLLMAEDVLELVPAIMAMVNGENWPRLRQSSTNAAVFEKFMIPTWYKCLKLVIKLMKPISNAIHRLEADAPYLSQVLMIWNALVDHAEQWVEQAVLVSPRLALGVVAAFRRRPNYKCLAPGTHPRPTMHRLQPSQQEDVVTVVARLAECSLQTARRELTLLTLGDWPTDMKSSVEAIVAETRTDEDGKTTTACISVRRGLWTFQGARHFPILRQAAIRLLSMHVTTAAAERNWSSWGNTYNAGRSQLNVATAEKMVYIKANIPSSEPSEPSQLLAEGITTVPCVGVSSRRAMCGTRPSSRPGLLACHVWLIKQAKQRWPDRILALAYGTAGFNGSGTIGCGGVPVSHMLKEAVRQFSAGRVVMVDEFRTSRVSSAYSNPSEALPGQPPETFRWLWQVYSKAKRSPIGPGPRPNELCRWEGRPAMPKPGQPGQEWVYLPDKALSDRLVIVDEFRTSRVSSSVHARQPCELHLPPDQPRPADWVSPAGQVNERLVRPAWSLRHAKYVRGLSWCHQVPPNPPTPPPLAQARPAQAPPPPPPAQAQPLPASPGPATRTQAPPGGRWLDRVTNGCLNLQRIEESMQRPLELCSWKDLEALPPIGKEYQQGYKWVNDRLPKGRQRLHRAAEYRRGIDGRARNNA
ncbi:hypothetical protein QJQ45_003396 [Haematococcus lacustris]|nr:hypothetical protein QJQ45_003396 [Haematococcus lacustris]